MSDNNECSVTRRVPFCDVDAMHVVWYGNYLKYFEEARLVMALKSGLDFFQYMQEKGYVFPVIRSQVKHIYPLRLADEFTCSARLREARNKIVTDFEVRLQPEGRICARGTTEQVAMKLPDMEMEYYIPEDVRDALLNMACGPDAPGEE